MRFGRRRNPQSYIICSNAPAWVADLMNVATDADGIVDQHRQEFIVDALHRIKKGRFTGEKTGRPPKGRRLKRWRSSEFANRSRYVVFGRGAGDEDESLLLAYQVERAEVMMQVIDHLASEPYDGTRRFNFRRFHRAVRPDGSSTA